MAAKLAQETAKKQEFYDDEQQLELLVVIEDFMLQQFKEKQLFDQSKQPFAPINIMNVLHDLAGDFNQNNKKLSVTVVVSLDKQETEVASSLMFRVDQKTIENNIDSLADQIIEFNSEQCKLTKNLRP